MTSKDKPFLIRLREMASEFHSSERQLADLMLNSPGSIASYTATEIAGLAQVSTPTVSRFVRKLGYASFDEARRAVRAEQSVGSALLRMQADAPSGENAVARHREMSFANLETTYSSISTDDVDRVAEALVEARRIWCIGFRAGQPLAQYLGWQTSLILENVVVLPRAGETLAEAIASMSKDDVVVVIALKRKPKVVAELSEIMIRKRIPLAVIEDSVSQDTAGATWHFNSVTNSAAPLLNHVSSMAICNLIAARTLELSGEKGRKRMASIEDAHGHLAEL